MFTLQQQSRSADCRAVSFAPETKTPLPIQPEESTADLRLGEMKRRKHALICSIAARQALFRFQPMLYRYADPPRKISRINSSARNKSGAWRGRKTWLCGPKPTGTTHREGSRHKRWKPCTAPTSSMEHKKEQKVRGGDFIC
ncbi:hypothetical protein NDU88_004710 [Pleurodeles waltl]|uniref:Uncharacterized protein n=1 Tax=Pleurodeles waltl TaxID=8319 RepID=A0AAV7NNF9_PLEWA|nr:hypothetical protein NDU88_004710 [Pleurodeles waltl]